MFKFNNKDSRTMWHSSGVFIVNVEHSVSLVNFEHVWAGFLNHFSLMFHRKWTKMWG